MAIVEFTSNDVSVLVPKKPKEMISVGVTPEGKTIVRINSSSISVIQECLRKAQYLLEEKWKPEHESPATIFGSAIHKALEVFYSAPWESRGKIPSLETLEAISFNRANPAHTTCPIELAVLAFTEKAQALAPLPDGDKRSILNGVWILHHYFKSYINDPYQIYSDDKGPFIERTFTHRLHEDDKLIVDLFGTIDFVFRHITDGILIPGDHKTTSSLNFAGQSYFDRERPNHQYTGYLLAVREVFGIDVNEFMVNALEVKPKPKTARGSAPNFPRQITRRDADDFVEFKAVVMKTVRDYLEAKETQNWPLGPVNSCNMYGSCSYKQVCAAPKSLRKNVLSAKFVQGGAL